MSGYLEAQRQLIKTAQQRWTPVLVTLAGIIYDGQHAVRAAAEESVLIDIQIVAHALTATATSILALPVR